MPDPQPTPVPDESAASADTAAPAEAAEPVGAGEPADTAEPGGAGEPAGTGEPPVDDADPTEDELLRTAVPATVRHAPRYSAFLTTGTLVGLVVGLLLAVLLADGSVSSTGGVLPFLGGSNGVRLLCALTGALLGLGVGAGLALWADRRSLRR